MQPWGLGFKHPNHKMQSFFSFELQNLEVTAFRYLNQLKNFLHDAHKQHHNVLISSEELCSIPLDGAAYLRNMVHNFQAKIVIIFRDSLSRALSNYRQTYPWSSFSDKGPMSDFGTFVY